jgi:hypothetical protein
MTIILDAKTIWMPTGLTVKPLEKVRIKADGEWSANPVWHRTFDANGNPDTKAADCYALEGVAEGSLVGRLGSEKFFIGKEAFLPQLDKPEELFLTINDDVKNRYGAGYQDNQGELSILIYVTDTRLYRVLTFHSESELETAAAELLQRGFEPVGGISVVAPLIDERPAPLYSQAFWRKPD